MDWVAKGSFKGDLEMLDKSGNGVGKIHVAVKFERPGQSHALLEKHLQLCVISLCVVAGFLRRIYLGTTTINSITNTSF